MRAQERYNRAISIRQLSGLTQAAFAEKYHIPKRTIEQWEEERTKPKDYILDLLERAVRKDFNVPIQK